MKIRFTKKSNMILMLVLCFVAGLAKIIQFSQTNFCDFGRILRDVISGRRFLDKSYDFTENIYFVPYKILHFDKVETWGIFFSIIGMTVFIVWVQKYKHQYLRLDKCLCLACFVLLINLYTFNISKELLQFLMMMPTMYVALNNKIKENKGLAIIVADLMVIALLMRTYYILIAIIFILITYIFYLRRIQSRKLWIGLILFIFTIIIGLYFLRSYNPSVYYSIATIRRTTQLSYQETANTTINDWISGTSPIEVFLNFLLTFFRLLFPIEIIGKGIFQIIFAVVQIYVSYFLLNNFIRNVKESYQCKKNYGFYIPSTVLISVVIVSAIFEPDFGSFIRHELMFFPLIFEIIFNEKRVKGMKI